MPQAKRSIQSEVAIDGLSLVWRLHREQQWFTVDGWKGVAIHVNVAEGAHRELHLEYPATTTKKLGIARAEFVKQNISPAKVEAHIRLAMEAGYDPDSRGKPFVFEVPELPG